MNKLNYLLLIATFVLISSVQLIPQSNTCDEPLLITDIDNPPTIIVPTCIEFDASITDIPQGKFYKNGNITGVIGEGIENVRMESFESNRIDVIVLPNVKYIGAFSFRHNPIRQVTLGTGFTEPTEIVIGTNLVGWWYLPFDNYETIDADLILGEFVLPKPIGKI